MVKISATDDLGTGLIVHADAFGTANPLFTPALSGTELRRADRGDGTIGYAFALTGHPDIPRASLSTIETSTSVEILGVTYRSAANTPLIMISDTGITFSDDYLPPSIPLDLTDAALDFARTGRVSLAGDDVLTGNGYDDYLRGLAGNDKLIGNDGNDMLFGDEGDDILRGGTGADLLDGGAGTDTAVYAGAAAGVTVDLRNSARNDGAAAGDRLVSIENVLGTDHDDTLKGTDTANRLIGGKGNDLLSGRGGNDRLNGGDGDDRLIGGAGNDRINGGDGNDVINGGAGADRISAGAGDDRIIADNDDISIDGGAGNDLVDFSSATGSVSFFAYDFDRFTGVESVIGSDYGDSLYFYGVTDALTLTGGAGSDTIDGGEGDDVIDGGDDSDYLYGNYGNDEIRGGKGGDSLTGGGGDDVMYGGAGNDYLSDYEGHDVMYGGGGTDSLDFYGYTGHSARMYGGKGNDWLSHYGGSSFMHGGAGRDYLYADTYDLTETARMIGGGGADTLVVNSGTAVISGGGGRDSFQLLAYYSPFDVVITDWAKEELVLTTDVLIDYSDPEFDWSTFNPTVDSFLDKASVVGDDIVFEFTGSASGTLTLENVTNLDLVGDYIIF